MAVGAARRVMEAWVAERRQWGTMGVVAHGHRRIHHTSRWLRGSRHPRCSHNRGKDSQMPGSRNSYRSHTAQLPVTKGGARELPAGAFGRRSTGVLARVRQGWASQEPAHGALGWALEGVSAHGGVGLQRSHVHEPQALMGGQGTGGGDGGAPACTGGEGGNVLTMHCCVNVSEEQEAMPGQWHWHMLSTSPCGSIASVIAQVACAQYWPTMPMS